MIGRSGLYEYAVDSAWRIGSIKGFFGSVITVVPSYNSGLSLLFPTISSDLITLDELVTTKVCYKKLYTNILGIKKIVSQLLKWYNTYCPKNYWPNLENLVPTYPKILLSSLADIKLLKKI